LVRGGELQTNVLCECEPQTNKGHHGSGTSLDYSVKKSSIFCNQKARLAPRLLENIC
jgi:hypothetical protein